jgi:phosphotransferase system  glucose/maltose/N-acetylglucosamine-specific IIC component
VRISHFPRAVFALAGGLFITFSQSHAAVIGLSVFIAFALLTSFTTLIVERRTGQKKLLPISVVNLIGGLLALVAFIQSGGFATDWYAASQSGETYSPATSQLGLFLTIVAGWALVVGAIEIYLASKEGFSERSGRDFLISAFFSLALAALFLLVAPDVVSSVGFFGAYLILLGVHWGIAAFGEGKKLG